MKYISLTTWRDLSDGHLYLPGDEFPWDGREIKPERLYELESGDNRAGLTAIQAVNYSEPEDRKEEAPEPEPEKKPAKAPRKKTTAKK